MAIQTLNTIKKWFKTGLKPSQDQFWDTWDSFRHKFEKIPLKDIEGLETTLDSKAEKSHLEEHKNNQNAHAELFLAKEDKSQKGIAGGYAPLNDLAKIASQYLTIINDLTTGGSASILSAEQGVVLKNQIDGINTLLSSDNVDLDTIQEIVDAIEEVQISIDTILVNDLTSGGVTKALTAEMGKKLDEIKLTATIATDAETQITETIQEDSKIISRSKLFNWWTWIKNQTQIISSIWNFEKGLKVERKIGNYDFITEMTDTGFIAKYIGPTLNYTSRFSDRLIQWNINRFSTILYPANPTQENFLYLPNQSGTLAIKDDFLKTPTGTTTTPALIIPNGILTTVPQNGAIERDENGALWETHNNSRNRIATTDYINSIYSSGTYTPTLEETLNITGAALISATYTKIDNIVNVMIALTATPVSFSDVQIDIALPFNRNVSTNLLSGIATGATANANFSAQVSLISESKAAIIYKVSTSGVSNITANFSYSIN